MSTLMSLKTQVAPADDLQLARQARDDANAFAELYRRHVTRVYRYQIAHTGNVKDAEDLTSQTFIAALEGIRSFRGSGSFAAWIIPSWIHQADRLISNLPGAFKVITGTGASSKSWYRLCKTNSCCQKSKWSSRLDRLPN